jgi:hypothetical protein
VSVLFTVAGRILAGIMLLGIILGPEQIVSAAGPNSPFNIQAQTGCEAEMLGNMGAREVVSGKAYDVWADIARAYGRAIPHIYIFPGSWNMAYIAASAAVDGRGKIVVGQQAIERFDTICARRFSGTRDGASYERRRGAGMQRLRPSRSTDGSRCRCISGAKCLESDP